MLIDHSIFKEKSILFTVYLCYVHIPKIDVPVSVVYYMIMGLMELSFENYQRTYQKLIEKNGVYAKDICLLSCKML